MTLLCSIILISAIAISQTPDFTATWKLNSSLSKLNSEFTFAPNEIIIDQKGNDIKVEKHSSFQGEDFTINEKFTLDGKEYSLAINNGPNHLHGGKKGFDKVVWDAKPLPAKEHEQSIEFHYLSKDGEEGYPGNLNVEVVYTLGKDNSLKIAYQATTDKKTIVKFNGNINAKTLGFNNGFPIYIEYNPTYCRG